MKFCLLILSSVADNPKKVKIVREMKTNLKYKIATQQLDMVVAHMPQRSFSVPESRGGVLHLTNRDDDVPDKVSGKTDCMPKSATNHHHLSSYSEVQYFSGAGFFSTPFLFGQQISLGILP